MITRQLLRLVSPLITSACLLMAATLVSAAPTFDQSLFEAPTHAGQSDDELTAVLRLVNSQELDQAEATIRDIVKRRPRSAPAQEILGTVLALQGNLPDAVLALEKAVELSPEQASALTKLGDIAMALGNAPMAKEYFLKAVAVRPAERRAHQRLGLVFEQEGDIERAVRHYQLGLLGTAPGYLGVRLNLAQIYVRTGRHEDAIELLSPLLEQGSNSVPMLRTLAAAEAGAGRPDRAVEHLSAAALREATPGLLVELGDMQRALERTDAAMEAYRQAVNLAERPDLPLIRLGELHVSLGDFEEAERAFVAAVEANPESGQTYHSLGSMYGLTRRHNEALETFRRGLEVSPDSPALLRGAAVALIRLERGEDAISYARRLAEQSHSAQDHFVLASLLEQTGHRADAERTYREVLERDAQFWPALNNLASLLIRNGDAGQSLGYARKAYELSGDQVVQPAHTYGWALLEHGDHQQAVEVLETAKRRQSSHVLTRYHLGLAYLKTGATAAARSELQAALELDDQFEFAAEAQQQLGSL